MTQWIAQLFSAASRPFIWWVVIAPWERGVRVRLGRTAVELKPGIHFRLPWVDRIYVQSIRKRVLTTSNLTTTDRRGTNQIVSFSIEFEIVDIVRLYQSVAGPEAMVRTLVASRIAHYLYHSDSDANVAAVEADANLCRDTLESWGLAGIRVCVTGLVRARVYRLINTDYETSAGLYNLEECDGKR